MQYFGGRGKETWHFATLTYLKKCTFSRVQECLPLWQLVYVHTFQRCLAVSEAHVTESAWEAARKNRKKENSLLPTLLYFSLCTAIRNERVSSLSPCLPKAGAPIWPWRQNSPQRDLCWGLSSLDSLEGRDALPGKGEKFRTKTFEWYWTTQNVVTWTLKTVFCCKAKVLKGIGGLWTYVGIPFLYII